MFLKNCAVHRFAGIFKKQYRDKINNLSYRHTYIHINTWHEMEIISRKHAAFSMLCCFYFFLPRFVYAARLHVCEYICNLQSFFVCVSPSHSLSFFWSFHITACVAFCPRRCCVVWCIRFFPAANATGWAELRQTYNLVWPRVYAQHTRKLCNKNMMVAVCSAPRLAACSSYVHERAAGVLFVVLCREEWMPPNGTTHTRTPRRRRRRKKHHRTLYYIII